MTSLIASVLKDQRNNSGTLISAVLYQYKHVGTALKRFIVHVSPIFITKTVAMSQNDTIGKIELNPSFVLSSDNTNCKNDIQ